MKKIHYIHRCINDKTKILYPILVFLMLNILPFSAMSTSVNETAISVSHLQIPHKGGWNQIQSGVTQDLNSISFICLNRGSVVGDEGIILRTGDGGDNWTAQNSGILENLYDIYYYDYSFILAVGESGTILLTNNSGQNWTVIQTGLIGSYYSGQMITDTIGVAVGVNAIFQPFFTRTDDAWITWESTSFYIEYESMFYEGRLSEVYFINASVGFATAVVNVPAGGAIVRTINGGIIWETVYFSNNELFGLDFTWEGIGYAVGNHGVILQTLDGGETWNNLISGVDDGLHAIDFSSSSRGSIVGDNGVILRTENGGTTWTQQISGTTYDLFGVCFITDYIGIVVGEYGLILRTTTGGYPDDIIPPWTNCTLTGIVEGDVYISNVTVTLSANDDISGVASTTYKLDGGQWTIYEKPFVVSNDGGHLLHFYSIDNAGNIEEEKTKNFTIQHPPNLNVTFTGGLGIKMLIKNYGPVDLANISWNLTLKGGFIPIGRQKSDIIDIKAGEEIVIRLLVFGIGNPTITLTIATSEIRLQGHVFLFFVRIV